MNNGANTEFVNKLRQNSTDDSNEEDVWLDFMGIPADPPDTREKCEQCR